MDAEKCVDCGEIKSKHLFYYNSSRGHPAGFRSVCKECTYSKVHYLALNYENTNFFIVVDGEILKKCKTCNTYKHRSRYAISKGCSFGIEPRCKDCRKVERETKMYYQSRDHVAYYRKNKERLDEYRKQWVKKNIEKERMNKRVRENKRRATKRSLPDTLTQQENFIILSHFNNQCPLTGDVDIQMDHFIPVSWGVEGTTHLNIIPLSEKLNVLKRDKNPIAWGNAAVTQRLFTQERWENLLKYLSHKNSLSVDDYIDFIHMCEDLRKGEVG